MVGAPGLVVFDLDGTLLRGSTVCEILARNLGREREMDAFEQLSTEQEIADARVQMASWYVRADRGDLLRCLQAAVAAPGVTKAVSDLSNAGVVVGLASVTWRFAAELLAEKFGIRHVLATALRDDSTIEHVWPRHKAEWLRELAHRHGVPADRTAAVGDSAGDIPMLRAAAMPFFVGVSLPSDLECMHFPACDLRDVSEWILSHWDLPLSIR